MKLCFLPYSFPPQKGGVHTWLYSICSNLKNDNVCCFVEYVEGAEEFDKQQAFKILREPVEPEIKFSILSKHVWYIGKNFFRNKNMIKKCSFFNLKEMNKCIVKMNYIQMVYFIQLLYAWIKYLNKQNTDVIICGMALPPGLIAVILKILYNIPYIIIAHGAEILSWQSQNSVKLLMTKVFQYAQRIIVNSHYTLSLLIDIGVERNKIIVINPGADLEKYHPGIDTSSLLDKLELTNHKIILTVSHLVDRKGHDMVIKALPYVLREVPEVKYLIVGEGPYKRRLEWLVREMNLNENVIFAGNVEDEKLPEYFNCCSVFVMPSRIVGNSVEGFGIAFIEANACGKPVIGGKSGGIEDAIIDNFTGYLVDPTDIEQIAQSLILLLKNDKLAKSLGRNGLRRVEQELNWETVAQKIRKVVLEINQ